MAQLKTSTGYNAANQLLVQFAAADLYSDAYHRNSFVYNTWQSPTEVIVQVSNELSPDPATDTDWVDMIAAPAKAGRLPGPWAWVRFKRATAGEDSYVNLVSLFYLGS